MSIGKPTETSNTEYWQSIDQWMESEKFRDLMKNEFPEDAGEWIDPVSRRQFLSVMGASVALAGAIGCNPSLRPASPRKIIPFVEQPSEMLPGVPLHFATAMPLTGGVADGLLVKSVEGRPIKIEGNPNHPGSLGGTNLYTQASVLGLYDPDRSKAVTKNGASSSFDEVFGAMRLELAKDADSAPANRGAGVRIVTDPTTSPTQQRIMKEFLERYPKAKWIQYEPINRDHARRAAEAAFGKPLNVIYQLDQAKVVLSLDSDFLSAAGPGDVRYARDFMAKRKVRLLDVNIEANDGVPPEKMNRLYAIESMLTNTGATADHRFPVKPSEIEPIARAIAAKFGVAGVTAPANLPASVVKSIDPLVADLKANAGAAVVLVGDDQAPAVHLLAHAINEKLGALGKIVLATEPLDTAPAHQLQSFLDLVEEMKAGKVTFLLLANVNPIYDAPADVEFLKALEATKAKGTTLHYGLYFDETASNCTWHINATHYLECWGDVRAYDGTVAIQQPLLTPLYDAKSVIELFAMLLGPKTTDPTEVVASDALAVVKATWRKHAKDVAEEDYEAWWETALRDGVVPNTGIQRDKNGAVTGGTVEIKTANVEALTGNAAFAASAAASGLEVIFRADPTILDGRFANNGWLQECPKPITTLTWDNAVIVSPKTAVELGCEIGYAWTGGERGRSIADVVTVEVDGRKIEGAVFIQPAHADGCVTLHLGYGRDQRAGARVAYNLGTPLGFDAYKLRTTKTLNQTSGAKITKTGKNYILACNQGHYLMEGRRPVRTATVAQLQKDHEFAQIPPATAAEYKELRALTPGTHEDFERLGLSHPFHSHGDEEHAHEHHDQRIIPLSLYAENPYKVNGEDTSKTYRRWGMAFDLGACTGCSACVIACVSENNTPVVTKDQVSRGRAMHWIRIDRYFSIPGTKPGDDSLGDKDISAKVRQERVQDSAAIHTHFQPVTCQQCEKAPCEVVCPVGATVHSADGLNDMTYNRCVGTRYCSNNCPYKARRFNFLQYTDYQTESLKLVNNPEVTVRQRGVMEKCTYCVQRIRYAEIQAEREWQTRPKDRNGRPKIFDGEIVTACQAACPTGAIHFGDLNDFAGGHSHSGSDVLRWKAEPHAYGLLAELNVMPRTSYVAAIKNPNPNMPQEA